MLRIDRLLVSKVSCDNGGPEIDTYSDNELQNPKDISVKSSRIAASFILLHLCPSLSDGKYEL